MIVLYYVYIIVFPETYLLLRHDKPILTYVILHLKPLNYSGVLENAIRQDRHLNNRRPVGPVPPSFVEQNLHERNQVLQQVFAILRIFFHHLSSFSHLHATQIIIAGVSISTDRPVTFAKLNRGTSGVPYGSEYTKMLTDGSNNLI